MSMTRVVPDSFLSNIQSSSFLLDPSPKPPRTNLPPNGTICSPLPLNSVMHGVLLRFPSVTQRLLLERMNISPLLTRKPPSSWAVVLNTRRGTVPSQVLSVDQSYVGLVTKTSLKLIMAFLPMRFCPLPREGRSALQILFLYLGLICYAPVAVLSEYHSL